MVLGLRAAGEWSRMLLCYSNVSRNIQATAVASSVTVMEVGSCIGKQELAHAIQVKAL